MVCTPTKLHAITSSLVLYSIFLRSLPQRKEAIVDLPLTSTAAYDTVSFCGHENDANIAYHATQGQDINIYDNKSAGVVAPGSSTETPLYEPM